MIDRDVLDAQVARASTRMRSHGGGIELVAADADGHVDLRFTGMCCGCPFKALTWRATVEPLLREVPGVHSLDAPGVRISDEAEARWRSYMVASDGDGGPGVP